jgi:coenzyme Q-binding protein COQ10
LPKLEKKFTKLIAKCRSDLLLSVVADVGSYSDFLPLCKNAEILDNTTDSNRQEFRASLEINYKFITERFISLVTVDIPKSRIAIKSSDTPFKNLYSEWTFKQIDEDCLVSFVLDASFHSLLIQKIISLSFDRISKKVVSAFEKRANDIGFI